MSYKALYRTYRPQQFDDVVGQDHIIKTFKNIIEQGKVSHAYLFAGPRGTGKTSIAHIFAKTLNCLDHQNKSIICGRCETCQLSHNNLDIVEIDAASNNGVSDIRTLIDNSKYAPSVSKYKIYIIDEVHMLSRGAFNALLKTLEEPPAHVIFILATTEPHKIPVTILSRTQRYNFRRISNKDIISRLKFVLDKENIKYDDSSLTLIANLSKGGMRDALSIADQAAAYSNNEIRFETISEVFGVVSNKNLIKLINNIIAKETKDVLIDFNNYLKNGFEINRIAESTISILKDYIVYSKTEDIELLDNSSIEEIKSLNITLTFAYDALEIMIKALSDLRLSEVPSQIFELALLKLLSLGSVDNTKEKEVKVENIFETQEINNLNIDKNNENTKSIITEDKNIENQNDIDKSIQEKIEKTMELTLNTDIFEGEAEEDAENESLQEEILKPNTLNNTDELNVESLFPIDENIRKKEVESKSEFTINDIINLLIQVDKEVHIKNKDAWIIKDKLATSDDRVFINLLNKSNLIASSSEFVLVSSDNKSVVKELNRDRKSETFIRLIQNIFEKPLLLFAITKEEFTKVKENWITLSNSGSLPKPSPIEKIFLKEKETNKAETLGNSLFGDIFNS